MSLDVAIVDYQLPGHSGLWLSRKLKRLPEPPAVLIYSAFSDYMLAAACVVAEADGLLSKAALGSDLYTAIRRAATGTSRLPPVPPRSPTACGGALTHWSRRSSGCFWPASTAMRSVERSTSTSASSRPVSGRCCVSSSDWTDAR